MNPGCLGAMPFSPNWAVSNWKSQKIEASWATKIARGMNQFKYFIILKYNIYVKKKTQFIYIVLFELYQLKKMHQ